jgi:hypothetical protein
MHQPILREPVHPLTGGVTTNPSFFENPISGQAVFVWLDGMCQSFFNPKPLNRYSITHSVSDFEVFRKTNSPLAWALWLYCQNIGLGDILALAQQIGYVEFCARMGDAAAHV